MYSSFVLKLDVAVRSVVIDGIVFRQCVNSLFIILIKHSYVFR